jgi:hypothetical protein
MSYPFQNSAKSENSSFQNPLANNIKNVANLINQGFQKNLLSDIENNQDKYHQNVDALSLATESKKSDYINTYFLSSIVSEIEKSNTELHPKEDGVYPFNCGKRVMPAKLKNKISGKSSNLISFLPEQESTVDIIKYKNSFSYHGVMKCNNLWGCPVCSKKISEKKLNGLSKLLNAHFNRFGSNTISMTLFTVPHGLGDDLKDINKRISRSFRKMTQSRKYRNLLEEFNGCGTSRNYEVTYGESAGFHPHIHCLHFFENSIEHKLENLSERLFELWSKFLKKNGFTEPSAKGFGCTIVKNSKDEVERLSEYFTKVESENNDDDDYLMFKNHQDTILKSVDENKKAWCVEYEMTKWHIKRGRKNHVEYRYSMFDLLRGYSIASQNNDEESRKIFYSLWLKYREGFKGMRQLFTKHDYFKISELELSDEELGESTPEDNEAKLIVSIPFDIWQLIVMMKARGTVLAMVQKNGLQGYEKIIELLKLGYYALPDDKQILNLKDHNNGSEIIGYDCEEFFAFEDGT